MEWLHEAENWVVIAFALLVIFAFKPMSRLIASSLDSRSNKIRNELEEAQRLRLEAEQILADYRRRQTEVAQEAKTILAGARADAEQIVKEAQAELQVQIEKHSRMAKDKIAQAEAKAVEEVQNHMLDISVAASRAVIRDYIAKGGNNDILKAASVEIERKLH